MDIRKFKCPNCGASLTFTPGQSRHFCDYCGSQVALDTKAAAEAMRPTAAEKVRLKELEIEERHFIARERDKARQDEELAAWRVRRNIWLLIQAVLTVLDVIEDTEVTSTLFALCFVFGGCYVYFSRPKTEKWLPWYYTGLGIFLLGFVSVGLYWFIGPILRVGWKKKHAQD